VTAAERKPYPAEQPEYRPQMSVRRMLPEELAGSRLIMCVYTRSVKLGSV
jgi:hypothetical protein